jgi:hypothetical protein
MRTTRDLISRIRAEFHEMPGMRLTVPQVQRLCGIERTLCQTVLDSLVEEKFLSVKPDGSYGRLTEGDPTRARQVRDGLSIGTRIAAASGPGVPTMRT